MNKIAIIGGSGLARFDEIENVQKFRVETPYGLPSCDLVCGNMFSKDVVFLPRHAKDHTIPPHKINYRSNIWALRDVGVTHVLAVAAVGGINPNMSPEKIMIPEQIIDYSYGREQTFYDGDTSEVSHIDFTHPYCDELRQNLINASNDLHLDVIPSGTYGVTQGPRLETANEIIRMEQDGCDVVGMTGMPEAALAKEAGLCYASVALSVNWAAGKSIGEITTQEINSAIENGMTSVKHLLVRAIQNFS